MHTTHGMMRACRLAIVSLALTATPLAIANTVAADTGDMPGTNSCQSLQLPVALTDGSSASYTVSGTYCQPHHWSENSRQVDVLVHGGTYDRTYWGFPTHSPQYSYVFRTLQAGRATFAFDQIGTGGSSKPVSSEVTADVAAYVTHQVVQHFRVDGVKVNLVGHSIGAYVAIREAGLYHDVDRLVTTGALHVPEVLPVVGANFAADLYPASNDPQFASLGLDPGYLTTRPGVRGALFYDTSFASPAVIAADEAHKAVLPAPLASGAIADLATPPAFNVSNGVTAPVLVVVGANDGLDCTSGVDCSQPGVTTREAAYFPNAESLSAVSVANTGHDLALHYSAPHSFEEINAWLQGRH